jgi:hypothetical protein
MRIGMPSLIVATVVLLASPSARAHLAEGTVTLTVAEAVPAPTGTWARAGGTAMLELSETSTIAYDVTVHDLTGPAALAHIHAGAAGVAGPPVFTLTKISDTEFLGETDPLTPEQVATLFAGGFYVNVHTATNLAGEVRGQITGFARVTGKCSCLQLSRKDFLKCVRNEIKGLSKDEKKSASARALKKAASKSSCGLAASKKTGACCVPPNDTGEIVLGALCVPVVEKKAVKQCAALGGTVLAGQSCIPTNGCFLPASPSGAFVD